MSIYESLFASWASGKGIPGEFHDEDAGHAEKDTPDESGAMKDCQMRADQGTANVENRHGQAGSQEDIGVCAKVQ